MNHRLCVAPMMDVTDRHCRYFLRQVNSTAFLYTEMIPVGALLHGDPERHLAFDDSEHPVAVQLGGCDPIELQSCAKLASRFQYDEINLNVGCPSERVQKGAFGACLMAEPELVGDCVRAIKEATALPVTVKHRVGIDHDESIEFLRKFVKTVAEAGCRTFIVHARNAILKGLSPKQNREVPPLRYEAVYALKREFPHLEFVINGGIDTQDKMRLHLKTVDGVMVGRAAYHHPWLIADEGKTRAEVVREMHSYVKGKPSLRPVTRHMLGLYHGHPRARLWRRMLSDPAALARNDPDLLLEALQAVEYDRPHEAQERGKGLAAPARQQGRVASPG